MSENYLLAVMEAVTYATNAGSNQELSDGNATTLDMHIEQSQYNNWMNVLEQDAKNVQYWANQVADNPNNKSDAAKLTAAQTIYQNDSTSQQAETQRSDSATQSMQNQVGQDSSSIQQRVQLESAVNQVSQTLSSALAQGY